MKAISPYLQNEYKPVKLEEESEDWELLQLVHGEIPKGLNGYFLRNSSNPQFQPAHKYHWFDGDGFIQGVKLKNGKAYFKGRFIRTRKFIEENAREKSMYGGLNGPVSRNNFLATLRRLVSFVIHGKNPFPNTSNTDLVYHHNTLFSLWLMCDTAYKIDLHTLDTEGEYHFNTQQNQFQGVKHGISAHPKVCPKDDRLFVMDFVSSWKRKQKPHAYISSISHDSKEISTQRIQISGRHLLHDIAVTEHYVMLIDMPAEMSPLGLKYRRNKPSRFGVLRTDFKKMTDPKTKEETDIIWFDDPSGCYIIHIINAYEENDNIVLYALRKDYLEIKRKKSNEVTDVFDGYLHKWVLNLNTGEIENKTGEPLREYFPKGSEFPTINSKLEGLKHRFSYLPHISRTSTFNFDGFSRFDHNTNTYQQYNFPKHVYNGELRYISNPEFPEDESKGWLITYVHDYTESNGRVYIDIFDADKISQGPICRLLLPRLIPIGFHTTWVDIESRL